MLINSLVHVTVLLSDSNMSNKDNFKSRRQDSLLYLDQSAVQIINVIRRYRQRPRRVLLLRAIESLAVVAYYHPDNLILACLEFKLHKCPYPCLTHSYHLFILLRVLSISFGNIVSGLFYEAVHFDRVYSLTSYKRSNLTFCGVPSLAASNLLLSVLTRWLWCRCFALPSVLAESR